jgi:hypothetical protein
VTTVLDDYRARSAQELTVSKGQHVRIVQKSLPNAPDWCLIRLLNDNHQVPSLASSTILPQQTQSNNSASVAAASSAIISSGIADLSLSTTSKYTEGLVPAAILKATRTSSSTVHLPPPLAQPISSGKSEPGKKNCCEE